MRHVLPPVVSKHRGFTLIELLVVISIIALLIGLLLPALGAARGVARQTKCAANLHQFSIAFSSYASEYKRVWPYAITRNAANGGHGGTIDFRAWNQWMMWPLLNAGTPTGAPNPWNPNAKGTIFECPDYEKSFPSNFTQAQRDNPSNRSYGMNTLMNTNMPTTFGVATWQSFKLPDLLKSPTETMHLMDSYEVSPSDTIGTALVDGITKVKLSAQRHSDSLNTLYADGHVGNIRPEDVPSNLDATTEKHKAFWIGS